MLCYCWDLGNGVYDIMSEAEYLSRMKGSAFIVNATTQVDGYGDHLLDNGLVARLRINHDDMRPEQWGAKGDGVTNDCLPLVHMFAKITSGTVTFRENATYVLGLVGGNISNPNDNPYRTFGCGNLLGGQFFSKPIMVGAHNFTMNGNNCLITIPDNTFGNTGMGILNFSGHMENVEIYGFNFDGKGRTIDSPNKNSNHIIFWAPIGIPESESIKAIHPVYTKNEKISCIENWSIHDNYFYDAGAMYRKAGDWGGDHILIINPAETDGLYVENNKFEAWGRWVFAIDLGGQGECLRNIKFNNNTCIGANGYLESYSDGKAIYLLDDTKPRETFAKKGFTASGIDTLVDRWRWRALGLIDFEAKKCFNNVEFKDNYIVGSGGWAINGNSRINRNFLIKDNYWNHVGGGYPYGFELYSGMSSDFKFEHNEMYGVGVKVGYFTNNFTFINNYMTSSIRTFGIAGKIDIENNTTYEGGFNPLWSHEANNYQDDFITLEQAKKDRVKVIYKNNDTFISANFNDFIDPEKDIAPYIDFDVEPKGNIKKMDICAFNSSLKLDPSIFSNEANQPLFANGVEATSAITNVFNTMKFKVGDIAVKSLQVSGVVKGYYFKNVLVEDLSKYGTFGYNWGAYASSKGYTNIDLICTEEGYLPGTCEYGFVKQNTHISYIIENGFKPANAFISTDENLYYVPSTNTSKLFEVPTHEEGSKTYTHTETIVDSKGTEVIIEHSVDVVYIGKLGKFELRCE